MSHGEHVPHGDKKIRDTSDGPVKTDLIYYDPIVNYTFVPDYDALMKEFDLSKEMIDVLIEYVLDLPENYIHHIDAAYLDFIRDIHLIGGKTRYIDDFWGWMPVTHITYKQDRNEEYMRILQKHGLMNARVYVSLHIPAHLDDDDLDDMD